VIRRLRASRFLLPATFLTGVVVSGLEFVCTGQVYIPTILYMMSQAEGRRGAITLLVLYNLAFISPMVAILLAVRSGLSRSRLGQLSKKSVGAAKLLMALMLLFIGAFMIAEEVGGLL
jgi:cytochrome c biogenesis protein CcdA